MSWPLLLMLAPLFLPASESIRLSKRDVPEKIPNIGTSWKALVSDRLPTLNNGATDLRFIPYVGNGYLAYVPYSDAIHLAGLYSGHGSASHLARITPYHAFTIQPEKDVTDGTVLTQKNTYSLNVAEGYYEEKIILKRAHFSGSLRIYAHADPELRNVLIQEVYMERDAAALLQQDVIFEPRFLNPTESGDVTMKCDFIRGVSREKNCSGTIHTRESSSVQPTNIYMFYTYPKIIMMRAGENSATYQFIIVVDTDKEKASDSFNLAKSLKTNKKLYDRHVDQWKERWSKINIDIDGNKDLENLAYGSMYYLLSALPHEDTKDFQGLAHDGTTDGHVKWYQDIWTLPVALVFSPASARNLLKYRTDRLKAARKLAKEVGLKGAKFPWESAKTGNDVTPKNCDLCPTLRILRMGECKACNDVYKYADHVTSDVAMAGRLYVSATDDRNWLENENGLALLRETAEYFVSKAVFNKKKRRFGILGVVGPDSYQLRGNTRRVNNDMYTNAGATLTMIYARYAACLIGKEDTVPKDWLAVARQINFPVNNAHKYFEPFDGYSRLRDPAKKKLYLPGPLMVDYPLALNITGAYRRKNMEMYETKLVDDPPVFAHAAIVMNHLALNDSQKARKALAKMTDGYPRGPFLVWTDTTTDVVRTSNFVAGAAAFLSTLLFGYGGIRILHDRMDINPLCLPDSKGVKFTGVKYMGAFLNIELNKCDTPSPSVTLTLKERLRDVMFKLRFDTGKELDIVEDTPETFPQGLVSIFPTRTDSSCSPPYPPNPKYGSIISSAPSISRLRTMTLILIMVLINSIDITN